MKYVFSAIVLFLVAATVFAGWAEKWALAWIALGLSLVFGLVTIGVYAIEDKYRKKPADRDSE